MLVVGLTGGLATGKSTVSALYTSASPPVPVIDADALARTVVEPGTRAYHAVVRHFGTSVLLPNGALNRQKLASIVFNDERERRKLNAIVHPAVRWTMLWGVVRCWLRGEKVCVVDVPLLFETGLDRFVGRSVVVFCPEDLQLARATARDASTPNAALSRINSQLPMSRKVALADYVIDNSGTREQLERNALDVLGTLRKEAGWTYLLTWLVPPLGVVSALVTVIWRRWVRWRIGIGRT